MKKLSKIKIMKYTNGINEYEEYNPLIDLVVTDSREVKKDCLYVALKGENFDGHDFIEDAIKMGASLILSEKKYDSKEIIKVENTYLALGELSKGYLNEFNIKKIGITGSSGKTTTKDMVYHALSARYETHRTIGNFNNHIGLPLTALSIEEKDDIAVFEMGMSELWEIDYLCKLTNPHIGIITNIGTAHIGNLKTQENIFKAKMEISNYMTKQDLLIVNGDDSYLSKLKKEECSFRLIKYGFSEKNDLIAYDYKSDSKNSIFKVKGMDREFNITLPAIGKHNVLNSLSAIATCIELGMRDEEIQKGLSGFKPSKHSIDIREIDGIKIINDSYNANPESITAVLESFKDYGQGRRIAILGDMLELGDISEIKHREIGEKALKESDICIFIGNEMKHAKEAALSSLENGKIIYHFIDKNLAINEIKGIIKYGDIILIKGSRGMKLDELADGLIDSKK